MPVGFGFSVGDFIASIKLVGTVIDSLSSSSKSSAELQEIFSQLRSLETALKEVKDLEVDGSLHAENLALRQSAAQCQETINDFLRNTKSYHPHLLQNKDAITSKDQWKNIKWALCKREDLARFKVDLLAHTESINLLLTTLQMRNMKLNQKDQQAQRESIVACIQDGFSRCMQKFTLISNDLTGILSQTRQCLEAARRIITINIRVFQILLDLQNFLLTIPGQVERQRPVFLNDAAGRYCPFHLEFIKSWESLTSVLSHNFKSIGTAAQKIQDGNFTIHDAHTKKDITLDTVWEDCFVPGQYVEMSIIIDNSMLPIGTCPKCQQKCPIEEGKEAKCGSCDFIFLFRPLDPNDDLTKGFRSITAIDYSDDQVRATPLISKVTKRKINDEEDLTGYRRVRFRTTKPSANTPMNPLSRLDTNELQIEPPTTERFQNLGQHLLRQRHNEQSQDQVPSSPLLYFHHYVPPGHEKQNLRSRSNTKKVQIEPPMTNSLQNLGQHPLRQRHNEQSQDQIPSSPTLYFHHYVPSGHKASEL